MEVPFKLSNRVELKIVLGVGFVGLWGHCLGDVLCADVEDVFHSTVEVGRESQELYA